MTKPLTVIGAPSSAGAYGPGQEQAPDALRAAGLLTELRRLGVQVEDAGDVPGFRWQADPAHPRAMNVAPAARVARGVAQQVQAALDNNQRVLVLGGDCTIELGTVAGALAHGDSLGLVYIDLDTDLNTPASTADGALDWMGVAHLLALPDCRPELTRLGPRAPMLRPDQVHFFANDNVKPFEREVIDRHGMAETRLAAVAADPAEAARAVVQGWAANFERLLVHLDADVLDFADFPLAENTRRNWGLRFEQLILALGPFLAAPNFSALTLSEINPDHGAADGSTLRDFVKELARVLASAG